MTREPEPAAPPAKARGRADLDVAVRRLARTPILLVASDFDGTLAPIVDDPDAARPLPAAMIALRDLARIPRTHVAVVSGRALLALRELASFPERVILVGSHGVELDFDPEPRISAEQRRVQDAIGRLFHEMAARHPGLRVEEKPGGLAFHYRRAPAAIAEEVLAELDRRLATLPGIHRREGKMVLEVSVHETSKGAALAAIRRRVGAAAVIFVGDDRTDEEAFGRLRDDDVGVKVGEGETCAAYRIADPAAVALLLARLARLRAQHLGVASPAG